MMNDLSDRTALVTGASSGIGKEIAELYASKGCNLVITARREEFLQKIKVELETLGSARDLLIISFLSFLRPNTARASEEKDGAATKSSIHHPLPKVFFRASLS